MSLEPFLNLTFFSFLPVHLPEEDPRHWAQEEGQEEAAVHQTIFQPSLRPLRAHRKIPLSRVLVKSPTVEEKNASPKYKTISSSFPQRNSHEEHWSNIWEMIRPKSFTITCSAKKAWIFKCHLGEVLADRRITLHVIHSTEICMRKLAKEWPQKLSPASVLQDKLSKRRNQVNHSLITLNIPFKTTDKMMVMILIKLCCLDVLAQVSKRFQMAFAASH